MYAFYADTFYRHGHEPYLNLKFFKLLAASMPDRLMLKVARIGSARIAVAIFFVGDDALFGRYWGAVEHVHCLHFDACYYEPLAWCIANGYRRFEGGAQGEHKMARGLLPVRTWSAHWLAHPQFARAIDEFLSREGAGVADYMSELNDRLPFKTATPAD